MRFSKGLTTLDLEHVHIEYFGRTGQEEGKASNEKGSPPKNVKVGIRLKIFLRFLSRTCTVNRIMEMKEERTLEKMNYYQVRLKSVESSSKYPMKKKFECGHLQMLLKNLFSIILHQLLSFNFRSALTCRSHPLKESAVCTA